jgi:O-antigen ligase
MSLRDRAENWTELALAALLLVALGFSVLATGGARQQDQALAQWILAAALGVWVVSLWVLKPGRLFVAPVCWGIVVFGLYAAAWYSNAEIEYVARREVTYVAHLATVFWIAALVLRKSEFTSLLTHVLAVIATLVAAYGIYQFATGSDRVWHFIRPEQYAGRASGTFICPNHFAAFLGMIFPLALGRAFLGRCHFATRLLLGYAALVLLVGIAFSLSRGAWIAAAMTLLFLLFQLVRRRAGRWLVLGLILVITSGVYLFVQRVPQVRERLSYDRSLNTANEMRTRLWIWQSAWAMWREQPWFGVGPGHFDHRFPKYRVRLAQFRPGRAHNDYLNVLVDWGIVGAGIAGATLVLLAWHGISGWRRVRREGGDFSSSQSDRAGFVLGATGGLLFAVLHSIVEFNLYIPATAATAAALAGGLAAHKRFATSRYWLRLGVPTRCLVSAFALGIVGLLAVQSSRMRDEGRPLERARALPTKPQQRLEHLLEAHAVEPRNPDTLYEIGECHRLMSWQGNAGWADAAEVAMDWYRQSDDANPHSPYPPLRMGMCLDWLGKATLAEPHYAEALRRDPISYYVAAIHGWHAFQLGDLHQAKSWFERSLEIKIWPNPISDRYLRIIKRKLAEAPPTPRAD